MEKNEDEKKLDMGFFFYLCRYKQMFDKRT